MRIFDDRCQKGQKMARVLVVYATCEGQTEKIAKTIAAELKEKGHSVDLKDAADESDAVHVNVYGGVVVGGPVHYSGYPTSLQRWVKENAKDLSNKPAAFFSVCLGILHKENKKDQDDQRKIVFDLFEWSSWFPRQWTIFAGALPYSRYGFIKRFFMKAMSTSYGTDTDTSRDYDYTSWEDVRRFSNAFHVELMSSIQQRKPRSSRIG